MEEKNIHTLVKTLVEKIRALEVELSLTKYERDELRKENESLKKGVSNNG